MTKKESTEAVTCYSMPQMVMTKKASRKSTKILPQTRQGHRAEPIEVENLRFDSKNPRFPRNLFGVDEEGVIKWMLENANIIELMNSIGEQGYFEAEPIVVVPSLTEENKFEVVEGNRRLTAVKLLLEPERATVKRKSVIEAAKAAKHKPIKLPCLQYGKAEDVLHFLAFRHVTGILAWDPLQKARYLKRLAETENIKKLDATKQRRHLAREIGSTPNYVARLLAGLAVFESLEDADFFQIPDLDVEGDRYSVLTTAVTSYKNIAQFLGLESSTDTDKKKIKKANLKKLAKWLFERPKGGKAKVAESRDIQKLNRVIGNAHALEKFESGNTLDEADMYTEGPLVAFRSAIADAKNMLKVAMDVVPNAKGLNDSDLENVQDIKQIAIALAGAAKETKSPSE